MVSKVSSIHNGAALILLLLQVFAGELYIHTAEALDEGQVNAIVNENCTSYLKLYNTRLNYKKQRRQDWDALYTYYCDIRHM